MKKLIILLLGIICHINIFAQEPDFNTALRAAQQGDVNGQFRVGDFYYEGKVVAQDYKQAVYWFKKAAEQGNAYAQLALGFCYAAGKGVSLDDKQAFYWYKKAAEQGDATAQNNLALCYEEGKGTSKDYQQATFWYKKSVEQGNVSAQFNLGNNYCTGTGVPQDYQQAVSLFKQAAEQGHSLAQNWLGGLYYDGKGVAQNYEQAVYWFKKSAEQGNDGSQSRLGDCYSQGHGVSQDYQQAVFWYRKAAEQGNAYAQNRLGWCYEDGKGVVQDYQQAVSWYRKAAEQGFVVAQFNLGWCYEKGQGVSQDYQQAVSWYRKAAEQGYAYAQDRLGWCYEDGKGVVQDYQQAVSWYRKVAEKGHSYAQRRLGTAYYKGIGVSQDYKQAFEWYSKAAEQDNQLAQLGLAILYAKGTGVQKDTKKALEYITQAEEGVKKKPISNMHDYLQYRGEAFLALNDMAKAKDTWKELQEKYPEEVKVFLAQEGEVFVHTMNNSFATTIDFEVPVATEKNANLFAFIIANEDYKRLEAVPYAANDGKVFAEYCQKTLGVPEKNLHMLTNATLGDIKYNVSMMKQIADAFDGEAQFVFYYAGHGLPAENQQDAFLLPVDGYGADGTGYSMNELYGELGALKAKSVVVLLDACFSGSKRDGGMIASARGVAIKARQAAPKGNLVVLSAAQGDETAYPYKEQGHGLFTYYLLKKLNETKGDVTLGELADYITSSVKKTSIVENGKLQTPTVLPSVEMGNSWRNLKLR